jgi:hypothetical protein
MNYRLFVFSKYNGKADITQFINRYAYNGSVSSSPSTTHGQFYLDNNRFFLVLSSDPDSPHNVRSYVTKELDFADSPSWQRIATVLGGYTTSIADQFQDYVVFRPNAGTPSDNIYVCLGVVTSGQLNINNENVSWAWSASTTWYPTGWSTPVGPVTRPTDHDDSYDFHQWPATYINQ